MVMSLVRKCHVAIGIILKKLGVTESSLAPIFIPFFLKAKKSLQQEENARGMNEC